MFVGQRTESFAVNLGTTIVHHGGPGSGQHAKMVNQTLIAGAMVGVCEALLYAHRAGLDAATPPIGKP